MGDVIDLTKEDQEEVNASCIIEHEPRVTSTRDTWNCDHCGFINHAVLPYCEQCAHQPAALAENTACASSRSLSESRRSQHGHGEEEISIDTEAEARFVEASAASSMTWKQDSVCL